VFSIEVAVKTMTNDGAIIYPIIQGCVFVHYIFFAICKKKKLSLSWQAKRGQLRTSECQGGAAERLKHEGEGATDSPKGRPKIQPIPKQPIPCVSLNKQTLACLSSKESNHFLSWVLLGAWCDERRREKRVVQKC
jgi:hypothetical protein